MLNDVGTWTIIVVRVQPLLRCLQCAFRDIYWATSWQCVCSLWLCVSARTSWRPQRIVREICSAHNAPYRATTQKTTSISINSVTNDCAAADDDNATRQTIVEGHKESRTPIGANALRLRVATLRLSAARLALHFLRRQRRQSNGISMPTVATCERSV